jgi:hypothetical protein
MSETEVSYIFIWRTIGPNPCPKCINLNGREYHQNISDSLLIDPQFGAVWDLNMNRSLAHGGKPTCRCALEIQVENVNIDLPEITEFSSQYEEFSDSLNGVAELFK